jgi:hypothetical protein
MNDGSWLVIGAVPLILAFLAALWWLSTKMAKLEERVDVHTKLADKLYEQLLCTALRDK